MLDARSSMKYLGQIVAACFGGRAALTVVRANIN